MKSLSLTNYLIFFVILVALGVFYNKFEEKRMREENKEDYNTIRKYLLDDVALAKSKKPILWIHVPYEYNSRNWLSFGSRTSFQLNQPYLNLTIRTIINHCDDDFTICVIDDTSFQKLVPGWSIDMTKISTPILDSMRTLGQMKLLREYGGMFCPISFVCMRPLIELYEKGTQSGTMFMCETTNRNITSTTYDYYPSTAFCGAPKDCELVDQFIDFIQRTISSDYTSETEFAGKFDRWANAKIQAGQITLINGNEIGVKTVDDRPILIDDLMANSYLNLYGRTYGILIPAEEILARRNFQWFARMSNAQVLESNTIIGNYLLVNLGETSNLLEPMEVKPKNWVGFWKTPDYPDGIYGMKPNYLGDNMTMTTITTN